MDKEIKISIRMKEADIIMMVMIEIKKVIIIAMKNMMIMITIVTEIEIIEEIKIEEIKISGHLRELGFHLLINPFSQKRSLKVIRTAGLIGLKFKKPIMIMLISIKRNRIMSFIKDTEMIHGLSKNMIQLKFINLNRSSKKLAIMNLKDSNK
jgi:hypothetical protein